MILQNKRAYQASGSNAILITSGRFISKTNASPVEAKISPSLSNKPMLEQKEIENYLKMNSTLVELDRSCQSVEMEGITSSDTRGPSPSPPEVVMKDAGIDLKQETEISISYQEYGILCTHILSHNIIKSELDDALKEYFIVTDNNIKIHKWIKQKKNLQKGYDKDYTRKRENDWRH